MNFTPRRSVFISATTRGLAEWRRNIFTILEKQQIEPIEQSLLTPESEVVRAEIEQKISIATGVICLVGPYYGYPLEQANSSGMPALSYTQYEWSLATELSKPRRVYLLEDSFFEDSASRGTPAPAGPESDEYRIRQEEFRRMVRAAGTTHPYRSIAKPVDLAMALAMINWNDWPYVGR